MRGRAEEKGAAHTCVESECLHWFVGQEKSVLQAEEAARDGWILQQCVSRPFHHCSASGESFSLSAAFTVPHNILSVSVHQQSERTFI